MKRNMFTTLFSITLLAVWLGSVTLSAAESVSAPAPGKPENVSRFEQARAYYIESAVTGFKIGLKLGGMPIPEEKLGAFKDAIAYWLDKDFLPFLKANGVSDEWMAMQFDPGFRDMNSRTENAKSLDELMKVTREAEAYTRVNYHKTYAVLNSSGCRDVMLKLQNAMIRILAE